MSEARLLIYLDLVGVFKHAALELIVVAFNTIFCQVSLIHQPENVERELIKHEKV